MDSKEIAQKVQDTLCDIAFTPAKGTAVGHQVRCLELLAKLTGMYDRPANMEPAVVVEDL